MNKVYFKEDNIYSYSSFSNPGNPFVHRMLVHRSMMSLFSFICFIYSLKKLDINISLTIMSLLPFSIAIIAHFTFEKERI
jgi:drug/metabolite transporter (DMT)-like permease